jgi:membrane protein implicated in regulation of membrane protease activity
MKVLRHIGSVAFVLGLFTAVFAGMPWYIMVADDPLVPWWLRIAVFCLLGGIFLVLLILALVKGIKSTLDPRYIENRRGQVFILDSLKKPTD